MNFRETLSEKGTFTQIGWFSSQELASISEDATLTKHRLATDAGVCSCRVNGPHLAYPLESLPNPAPFNFLLDLDTGNLFGWDQTTARPPLPASYLFLSIT